MAGSTIQTPRLELTPLAQRDAAFIQELVNTEGWLRFIGNRNIHSIADAEAYIHRIIENPDIQYWVTRIGSTQQPTGIITFIKRDYLEHPDIGFAFLPEHAGMGYAMEASAGVLDFLSRHYGLQHILATTLPDNTRSIRLLEKLGLRFNKTIETNGEQLWIYQKQLNSQRIS